MCNLNGSEIFRALNGTDRATDGAAARPLLSSSQTHDVSEMGLCGAAAASNQLEALNGFGVRPQ